VKDPVTEKAVRHGGSWLFVSFEGLVHPVDVSGPSPRFGERWSLLDSTDRKDGWRIGGQQHLALHGPTGRLYSLVHQGGPDTHKQPGTELWVYDVAARRRVQRIPLRSPGFTYLGVPIGLDWPWPFSRIPDWLVAYLPDLGVGSVAVTQDDRPLLVTGSSFSGSLAVYDGLSGEFLRRVAPGNMTTLGIQTPWTGAETKP
jgi:methylamine dehydrogenase heavy chain